MISNPCHSTSQKSPTSCHALSADTPGNNMEVEAWNGRRPDGQVTAPAKEVIVGSFLLGCGAERAMGRRARMRGVKVNMVVEEGGVIIERGY
jgi:hypothetical protein